MPSWFNMHEAKTKLSQLVARAQAGEDIVISRDGKAVARLVRIEPSGSRAAVFGSAKGKIWVAEDFNDPIPELEDAFYNGPIFPTEVATPSKPAKRKKPARPSANTRRHRRAS
jgi:prevent-host-death family protein